MGAAENLDFTVHIAPIGLTWEQALAYTGVGEEVMREWRRTGRVRFRPIGRRGALITERAQLDAALRQRFSRATGLEEDFDFGD